MDKDSKQKEWDEYQAFRSKVKEEVDKDMEAIEKEITYEA
jgi:hypothetical protein